MKTLITPAQVVALAFSGEELVAKDVVTLSDIVEVETRHLRPIMGAELAERLHAGGYATLLSDYVAPALAAWCRYAIQPLLRERCRVCHDGGRSAAQNDHDAVVEGALRRKAITLSHRLSDHLNANAGDYPEYNPKNNPLNYCSIYGDIIQVR